MANRPLKWGLIGFIMLGSISFTAWAERSRAVHTESTSTLTAAPRMGYRMPAFKLTELNSNASMSTDTLAGKPIFINFWTSWCTYCRLEATDIQKAYQEYGKKVVFLSVNVTSQDSMSAIEGFVKHYGVTWQVPLDTKGYVARKYQIIAYPTSYFVDKSGVIEDKVVGSLSPGTLNADLGAISK